jgi:hypothetical protein
MKNINFIKTPSIAQRKIMSNWWFFSCGLGLIAVTVILFLHGLQVHQWYTLSREGTALGQNLNSLSGSMTLYDHACKERQLLQEKKAKCDKISDSISQLHSRIALIKTSCASSTITSCSWSKQQVELILELADALCVTTILAQLQKVKGLEQLRLVSVTPSKEHSVVATLRCKV